MSPEKDGTRHETANDAAARYFVAKRTDELFLAILKRSRPQMRLFRFQTRKSNRCDKFEKFKLIESCTFVEENPISSFVLHMFYEEARATCLERNLFATFMTRELTRHPARGSLRCRKRRAVCACEDFV